MHLAQRQLDELAEYARVEEAVDTDDGVTFKMGRIVEKFNGAGRFTDLDFGRISSEFQKVFFKPLPVSARGETATHRLLGFDHRVALTAREGHTPTTEANEQVYRFFEWCLRPPN